MIWDSTLRRASSNLEAFPLPGAATLPALITAKELQETNFPPVSWVVRDLIPEGLTLLAGKPKLGKSWLALQMGLGVATGGEVLGRPVEQGPVLYAAMEDNYRRLKSRLTKCAASLPSWPDHLSLTTEWPRLDAGGLEAIDTWLGRNPHARLVIFDTLATVRPAGKASDSQYTADYAALRGLHALANSTGVGIVCIHHVRKAEADDPFDTVSGSTGLTGAADATLVLTSTQDGRVLYGRGRDLAEFEAAVSFDAETCTWSDLGRPSDVYGSETRKAIREALKVGRNTPKEIADQSGLDYDLCAKTLQRMSESGEVQKGGYGRYRLTPDPLG